MTRATAFPGWPFSSLPSALSTGLVLNRLRKREVRFMRAAMIGAHAVGHLLSAEQAGRLHDGALGIDPLGFDRVEPRTLDGQIARHDAHAPSLLLPAPVIPADPGPDRLTRDPADP